jgi:hypothetical protein
MAALVEERIELYDNWLVQNTVQDEYTRKGLI